MRTLLVDHWRSLTQTVHPADAPVLAAHPHSFNLDFPPPAFLGDVVGAPVLLLFANGGYDAVLTAREFEDAGAAAAHRDALHRPRAPAQAELASYYTRKSYSRWLIEGRVAIVNAVAYRSPRLSREPENRRIIPLLASYAVHRRWLFEEILPQAARDERLVVVHRNGLWKVDRHAHHAGVLFSRAPASPHLDRAAIGRIAAFLGDGAAG